MILGIPILSVIRNVGIKEKDMKLLITYLRPLTKGLIKSLVLKTIGALMVLLLPYLLAYVIDSIVPLKNMTLILYFGIGMIFISFFGWFCDIKANRNASYVAKKAVEAIRSDLFEKTLYLSNRNIDCFTIPSLESRLTSDTYNVHKMIGMVQRMGVRAPILLIGGVAVAFIMEPFLSLIMVCTLPFITLLVYYRAAKGIPFYTEVQKAQDKMISVVRENAQGIRIIKALSKADDEIKRYEKVNADLMRKDKKATARMAVINPMMTLFMNIGLVCVIALGAVRVSGGLSETGKIIAFTNYFTIISNAMMSISRIFVEVSKGIASAERIQEVFDCENEFAVKEKQSNHSSNVIEFEHVNFSYLGKTNNLTDISFSLKKGQTLGILGATGSGKTTILSLLLRFYDVDSGNIYVDGENIQSLDISKLRRKFGTVMQNDFIFQDSVRENIDFGRNLSEEDIVKAVKTAQADFIFDLSNALDTPLHSKGVNLSGGQRQRIYLARAFAQKPQILLLDDASSALDYATDAKLRKAIEEHSQDTAKIIVAQRISSILHADEILVLDQGKILARGTHRQLLENCPLYVSIHDSQMGGALLD